jgi:nitronate monooxygenase
MAESENKKLYEESMKMGDEGCGDKGRITTCAGTGVGLFQKAMPAGEIVKRGVGGCEAVFSQDGK